MKKYVKIAALVLVGLIFLGTFGFLYQKSKPRTLVYETWSPTITDLEKTTIATGKIEPRDEILIKPQISGIIDVVYKEAGEKVKKGEVIAKVKVIPELGQLNAAESRVRLAEISAKQSETDFERMKTLYGQKLISSEEYEKSEVAVKQAREELQTAKDNLQIVKEGITQNSASFSSTLIRSTIDGLILDVRNNGGGLLTLSDRIASRFTNEKLLTGYLSYKTGPGHNDFSTPEPIYVEPATDRVRWQKPVAILTNRRSYSSTNDFVGKMKQMPQAIIIGDKTGGGSGLPFSSELPNGWSVRFSASPMYDPDMQHQEFGIDPDIKVDMTSEDMQKGIDTIIETARKQLKKK